MTSRTITVTKEAYEALKSMKEPRESFTETILRVSKRRPLMSFFGVLKGEGGERFEKVIMEARKRRSKLHRARMERIVKEMGGREERLPVRAR